MRRRILPRLVAGVAALTLIASCGGGAGEGEASFSLQGCEPKGFIPGASVELCGGQLLRYMYTGLVTFEKDKKPVNAMAKSIKSKDQKTWTIKIKKGWKFHNGEKVTVDSFIGAWNAYAYGPNAYDTNYFFEKFKGYKEMNPESANAKPRAKKLSGLTKVNDYTMKVELDAPFGQFPLMVGYNAFTPLPKKGVKAAQQKTTNPKAYKAFEEKPIGNGPYRMDGKWNHDEEINLKKFGGYKGAEKAHVGKVKYKIYASQDTAYQDLISGNLDQTPVPPAKINSAKNELGDRFFLAKTSQFTYLGFPLYDKRFKNKDLRHAISMAINRKQINKKVFDGAHTPAKSMISPVVAGQRPNACKEYCDYNPKKAKQLFDKSGFKGKLSLWYPSDGGHEEWMQATATQLKKNLGLSNDQIELKKQPQNKFLDAQDNKKIDGPFRNSWLMDYPSMQNYMEPLYTKGGSSNRTFYYNKKVDKYIDEGNRQPTVAKGYPYYYKAEDQILEDMPGIPLWFNNSPQGHSDHIKNVRVDPFGFVALNEIQIAD